MSIDNEPDDLINVLTIDNYRHVVIDGPLGWPSADDDAAAAAAAAAQSLPPPLAPFSSPRSRPTIRTNPWIAPAGSAHRHSSPAASPALSRPR